MVPQSEAEALHRSLLNNLNIQVAGSSERKRARPASTTTRPPLHQPIVRPTPVKLAQGAHQHARTRPQSATTRATHEPVLKSKPLDIMLSIIQASKHRSRHELAGQLQQESTISAIEHLPLQPFVTIAASEGGWKHFFQTFNDGHTAAHNNAKHHRAHGSSRVPLPTAATVPPQSYNSASARRARLAQQVRRLRTLWAELKVPTPDQDYVTATYCSDCALSGEAFTAAEQEVQKQIALLLAHRTATIAVLRAITEREAALAAVQAAHHQWQQCCSRSSTTTAAAATVAAAAVEAVVTGLVELRQASAAVVAQITEWRALLWQPQAFMWKSVNYLLKMNSDVEQILQCDTRSQLLAAAGLSSGDMLLLLPALSGNSSSHSKQQSAAQHCTSRAAARLRAAFWERSADSNDCSEQQSSAQLMQVGDHVVIHAIVYYNRSDICMH
jgi:hypothetical protein